MKITHKTKIVQVRGAEVFFQRREGEDGEVRWLVFRKDVSALCKECRETRFKDQFTATKDPVAYLQRNGASSIPADFTTDLLSRYSANQYADGNAPARTGGIW